MRLPALVPLVLLGACAAPGADIPLPPPGTPVITVSTGTSEWGSHVTEIYQGGVMVNRMSEGVGRPQTVAVVQSDGVYEQVAALLAREGPRALRRQGRIGLPCPGSVDGISASPAVGRFTAIGTGCPGGEAEFEALLTAVRGVIAN